MGRRLDPKCRLCRRAGEKLFLKGEKCFTPKCPMVRRPYPPGQHGNGRPPRLSGYAVELIEKQKARHIYGLREEQFRATFERALHRVGETGDILLELLERRLDNAVYRLGFARSRSLARQLVTHGHFLVNGKSVNIPSFQVSANDTIELKPSRKNKAYFQLIGKEIAGAQPPAWLELNRETLSGRVVDLPNRTNTQQNLNLQLIVEYYSR
jgi:small subunit ribosomal protein S4